jgi:hypothetical protein
MSSPLPKKKKPRGASFPCAAVLQNTSMNSTMTISGTPSSQAMTGM